MAFRSWSLISRLDGSRACCALHVGLLVTLAVHGASAQGTRNWRPDERVLITSFAQVGAVALDQRYLYAATSGGLTIFEYERERWLPPLTFEDGYPPFEQPTALAVDPLANELWLGTALGSVWRWRALQSRWETVGIGLGEPVLAIVLLTSIADDAVFLQTRSGWHRAQRLSFGVQRIPSAQVPQEAARRAAESRVIDSELNAFRARLGVDARARRWPITSHVAGDRPNTYWFGTNGAFLFRFDAIRMQPDWVWFGAPSRGVSALALDSAAIWFGSDGRGPRNGVARASRELQQWTLFDPLEDAPNGRVTAIAATTDATYFAAASGIHRFEREAARPWQRFAIDDAMALAVSGTHVWVGTQHGLVHIRDGRAQQVLTGPRVLRVIVLADSVWVATNRGLMVAALADAATTGASWREAEGLPTGVYVDAARLGGRTYALSTEGLYTHDESSWRGPLRAPAMNGLGRLRRLLAADSALWIAGERGVARYDAAREAWLYFLAPGDIPEGPIADLAVDGPFVWLATPAGALRLQWRAR